MTIKKIIFDTPEELQRIQTETEYARNQILEIVYASFKSRDITNLCKRHSPYEWDYTIGEGSPHETFVSISQLGIAINVNGIHHRHYMLAIDPAELVTMNGICESYKVYHESTQARNILDHLRTSPFARGIKIDEVLREMEEEATA